MTIMIQINVVKSLVRIMNMARWGSVSNTMPVVSMLPLLLIPTQTKTLVLMPLARVNVKTSIVIVVGSLLKLKFPNPGKNNVKTNPVLVGVVLVVVAAAVVQVKVMMNLSSWRAIRLNNTSPKKHHYQTNHIPFKANLLHSSLPKPV